MLIKTADNGATIEVRSLVELASLLDGITGESTTLQSQGAVGDGLVDDLAALQAARAAAGVNGIVRGDPTKTYLCSAPLTLNVAQLWENVNVKFGTNAGAGVAGTGLVVLSAAGVIWRGGQVDGNGANQSATTRSIQITADDCTVENAKIINAYRWGITANTVSRYKIHKNTIINLIPLAGSSNSIGIWAQNTALSNIPTTEGGEISGNRIDFSDHDPATTAAVGILAWGASGHLQDGVSVKDNWIKHILSPTVGTTVLMDVRYLRGATISGNEFYGGRIGVTVGTGCIGCSITGNTGKDQTYAPFEAADCTYCTFSGNTGYCNGLANYGFACDGIVGFDHITITGNTIFGALLNAAFMSGDGITASNITLSGNTLQNDAASITAAVLIYRMTSGVFAHGNNLIGGDSSNAGSIGVSISRGTGHTVGLNNISRCNKGVRLLSDSGAMTDIRVERQHFVGGITTDYELVTTSGTFGTGIRLPTGVIKQAMPQSSHTGDTVRTALASYTLKGHWLRPQDTLIITMLGKAVGTNDTKLFDVKFGGTVFASVSLTSAQLSADLVVTIRNLTASSQEGHANSITGYGVAAAANVTSAVDTTSDVTIEFGGTLANGSDSMSLESYRIEIERDPN